MFRGIEIDGVKGSTHLSEYLTIPDAIILDSIHLCYLGTVKKMFKIFLNKANKHEHYIILVNNITSLIN